MKKWKRWYMKNSVFDFLENIEKSMVGIANSFFWVILNMGSIFGFLRFFQKNPRCSKCLKSSKFQNDIIGLKNRFFLVEIFFWWPKIFWTEFFFGTNFFLIKKFWWTFFFGWNNFLDRTISVLYIQLPLPTMYPD